MCYRCCESSAAQQGLPLARIVQNRINSPSKHLLRPRPTDGRPPDIWILFHAETLMPREPPAMQGMWQILLLGTNPSRRDKSSNPIQNTASHLCTEVSYSSFPKYICLVQKAEMTSQLQDQESRMFTEHRWEHEAILRQKISIVIILQRTQLYLFLPP